jgi:hypothetical protein
LVYPGPSAEIQVKCKKKPINRGFRGNRKVKMGKLLEKISWTPQDRIMKRTGCPLLLDLQLICKWIRNE